MLRLLCAFGWHDYGPATKARRTGLGGMLHNLRTLQPIGHAEYDTLHRCRRCGFASWRVKRDGKWFRVPVARVLEER